MTDQGIFRAMQGNPFFQNMSLRAFLPALILSSTTNVVSGWPTIRDLYSAHHLFTVFGDRTMIYSLAALMGAPMPQNIDPQEHLRYFSWIDFAFTSLICTIFVFRSELSKNGPLIFSKRKNARSIREILTSYCIFLVILFCLMRAFNLFVPSLPYWMTNTFNAGRGNRLSIADLAFIALAGVLAFIERLWLFVDLTTQNE